MVDGHHPGHRARGDTVERDSGDRVCLPSDLDGDQGKPVAASVMAKMARAALPQDVALFALVGLIMSLALIPLALLHQDVWAPFDRVVAVVTDKATYSPGESVRVRWDIRVHRRYPVTFYSHILHVESGRVTNQAIRRATTGGTGDVTINRTMRLPVDAEAGQWCYIVTGEVVYNALLTVAQAYPPACWAVR